jgi:DNA-binding transcriptional LysR family regulator
MDFNQIRYFLALADTLNFTRAAERCHVTQPALTQSIQRLEAELGGALVLREGRNNRLTELGSSLRAHFEHIEQTRRQVKATAEAVTGSVPQTLDIGVMCTVGPRRLSRFLADFQAANPGVQLILHDVAAARVAELLLSGAVEGAILGRYGPPDPRLRGVALFDERMVVAFPDGHPLAAAERVTMAEIARHRYVDRLTCDCRQAFLAAARAAGIALDIAFRSEREDWIQNAVRDGVGVSMIPEFSLLPPTLEHRPVEGPRMVRRVEIAQPAAATPSPALAALLAHAEGYAWPAEDRGQALETAP